MKSATYRDLTREQKLSIAERDYAKSARHVARHTFLKKNIPFLAGLYRDLNTAINRPAYRSAADYNMMEAVDTWQRLKNGQGEHVAGLQEDIDTVVDDVRLQLKTVLQKKSPDKKIPSHDDGEALSDMWHVLAQKTFGEKEAKALQLYWQENAMRDYLVASAAEGKTRQQVQDDLYMHAHYLQNAVHLLGYASNGFDAQATQLGFVFERNKEPLTKIHAVTDGRIDDILHKEKVDRAYRAAWESTAQAVRPEAKWQAHKDKKDGVTHLDEPLPETVSLFRSVMNSVSAMQPKAWVTKQWARAGDKAQQLKTRIARAKNSGAAKNKGKGKTKEASVLSRIKMPASVRSFVKRIKLHHVGFTALAAGVAWFAVNRMTSEKKPDADFGMSPYAMMRGTDSDSSDAITDEDVYEDDTAFVYESTDAVFVQDGMDSDDALASFYAEKDPVTSPQMNQTVERDDMVPDPRFNKDGINHSTMLRILQGTDGDDGEIDFTLKKHAPQNETQSPSYEDEDDVYDDDTDIEQVYFASSPVTEKVSEATLEIPKGELTLTTPYALRLAQFELLCVIDSMRHQKNADPLKLRDARNALGNSINLASDRVMTDVDRDIQYAYENITRAQYYMTGENTFPKGVGYGEFGLYVQVTSDIMKREGTLSPKSTEYQRAVILAKRLDEAENRTRNNGQYNKAISELEASAGALGLTADINLLAEKGRNRALDLGVMRRYTTNGNTSTTLPLFGQGAVEMTYVAAANMNINSANKPKTLHL